MKKMIMKKRICVLMTCLLLIGMLSGCGAKRETDREISIMLPGSPASVDPQLVDDTNSALVVSFCTGCLYTYDKDKKTVPQLAESYELSEDYLTYTFRLKKGLKWSDGRDLTAEDFVFAFQRLVDPDVGSNSVFLVTDSCVLKNAADVNAGKKPLSELGVSCPDAETLVIELEQPCPYFIPLMTLPVFSPCNEDFYHSVGENYATGEEYLISCGAYVIDRYEPLAMQVHMTKNPYFVDADQISIPGVNLQVVANGQQALMSYQSGGLDATAVSGALAELVEGDPELRQFSTASSLFIYLNNQNCPALGNLNIRKALSKSVDRDAIVKNVLKVGYVSMTRLTPSGYYTCADGSDFAGDSDRYQEQAGYDPVKAAELWKKGLQELGVSEVTLTFLFNSGSTNLIEAIAGQMMDTLPGLTIELKAAPPKEIQQAKSKGGYDLLYLGWVADYTDPTSFLALFLSDSSAIGYKNPDYDALYEKIQSADLAQSRTTREKLMLEAEDMLMNDMAFLPMFSMQQAYLIKASSDFQLNPLGSGVIMSSLKKEVD